ncbi:hypothetical protein BH10PLA2_BH10PLA2_02320 [soil metagenome]
MALTTHSLRASRQLRARKTILGIESLEERQLLSATPYSYASTDILIQLRSGAATPSAAQILPGTIIGPEIALVPGLHQVMLGQGVSVDQALAAYRSNPAVQYAEGNSVVHRTAVPNDPYYTQVQWALNNTGQNGGTIGADINAQAAWNVTSGSRSVIVATLDSGIDYSHPDIAANVWTNTGDSTANGVDNDGDGFIDDIRGWNFVSNNNNVMDDFAHGTHVAGILGAVGNNGTGVAGVAWNVQIMPVKMLDSAGNGTTANAVLALNYAVAHGARVVNISWNGGPYSQAFRDALQSAGNRGVLIVCAAGNDNANDDTNTNYPPSYNLPNMIVVAATDSRNNIAGFSNYGSSTVGLAAPGVSILSTVPGNSYGYMDGTSMATPQVAGAAALLLSADPSLSIAEIKARLLGGTDFIGNVGNNSSKPTQTNGILNVGNSIKADLSWNSFTSPTSVQAGQSFTVSGSYRDSGSNAGTFTIGYYRSSDGVFGNSDDVLLGTQTITGGRVGSFNVTSPSFSVSQGGNFTVFAKLDSGNAVDEFGEANNVASDTTQSTGGPVATTPSFSINNVTVTEGNSGTSYATFTVTLSAPLTTSSTVKYATSNGTATSSSDYTAASGTLTFSAGQTSKTFTVAIKGDKTVEGDETFTVTLSSPTRAQLGTAVGTGKILNDDSTAAQPNVIASDSYGYKAVVYPYDPTVITPSTPGAVTLINSGDDTTASLSFGSNTFNFYGTTYSSIFISSNGLVTFGSANNAYDNTNLSGLTQPSIAPLWDDWVSTNGQPMVLTLLQDTTGDGKPDRLIIEWNNIQFYGGSPWTQTFQVALQLNTGSTPGDIIFNYYFLDSQDSHAKGATATVGIKGPGSNQMLIAFNDANNPYLSSYSAIRITRSNLTGSGASSVSGTSGNVLSSDLNETSQSTTSNQPSQTPGQTFVSAIRRGQSFTERIVGGQASNAAATTASSAPEQATTSRIETEANQTFDDLFAHEEMGERHLPFRATGNRFVASDFWIHGDSGDQDDNGLNWRERAERIGGRR